MTYDELKATLNEYYFHRAVRDGLVCVVGHLYYLIDQIVFFKGGDLDG